MAKISVTILGSTGLVGQHFVRLLADHPLFEVAALTASPRSAGRNYGEAVDWQLGGQVPEVVRRLPLRLTTADDILAARARVIFSALPAAIAGPLEGELRARGCFVFSNASSHRHDPDVPLLVAEVNPDHLELAVSQRSSYGGFIVCGPNCSTAGLVMALRPLRRFGLRRATVTTMQAFSGAGRRGVSALDILGNIIPYIAAEEEKMAVETARILGTRCRASIQPHDLAIYATCCRVAVPYGHLESVSLETEEEISSATAAREFVAFEGPPQRLGLPTAPRQPLQLFSADDRPQPQLDVMNGEPERARGMSVSVGRLRGRGRRFDFLLLVHNTVRGAAGGCVLNAELAAATGLLPDAAGGAS